MTLSKATKRLIELARQDRFRCIWRASKPDEEWVYENRDPDPESGPRLVLASDKESEREPEEADDWWVGPRGTSHTIEAF